MDGRLNSQNNNLQNYIFVSERLYAYLKIISRSLNHRFLNV